MDGTTLPEEWRPVVGLEEDYEVSNWGRVRSVDRIRHRPSASAGLVAIRYRGRVLSPAVESSGHLIVRIGRRSRRVHRLVIEAFVGPCPPGMECCHNNGDPADNRVGNLRWGTRSDNNRDKVRHGTDHNVVKTHCPLRHVLAAPNLVDRRGNGRRCRACHLAYGAFRRADPRFPVEANRHYRRIMGGAL